MISAAQIADVAADGVCRRPNPLIQLPSDPLVVAHNPERARELTATRCGRIAELEARAATVVEKLDGQDGGDVWRGRKLSDNSAKARFFHEVCEAHLSRIIKVDLFTYESDARAQARAYSSIICFIQMH